MTDYLVCTSCSQETPVEAKWPDDMPVDLIIELCTNWKCNTCLDEIEAQIASENTNQQTFPNPNEIEGANT